MLEFKAWEAHKACEALKAWAALFCGTLLSNLSGCSFFSNMKHKEG